MIVSQDLSWPESRQGSWLGKSRMLRDVSDLHPCWRSWGSGYTTSSKLNSYGLFKVTLILVTSWNRPALLTTLMRLLSDGRSPTTGAFPYEHDKTCGCLTKLQRRFRNKISCKNQSLGPHNDRASIAALPLAQKVWSTTRKDSAHQGFLLELNFEILHFCFEAA